MKLFFLFCFKISNIDFQSYNDILKSIRKTDSEYVIFIKPGCILTPNSISKLHLFFENNDIDIVYGDEDEIDSFHVRRRPFFKPDWSPYTMRSTDFLSSSYMNY